MRRRSHSALLGTVAVLVAIAAGIACGGASVEPKSKGANAPKAVTSDKFKGATRCDTKAPGREVSYHDLSGSGKPDMIEVLAYGKNANGTPEGRVVCMELDTNHDGTLDLIRLFNDKGEMESEEADRNYDGKSDLWITYEKGVIAKQAFDTTFKTGKEDEIHYYRDGKLKRIERDRNGDGKIDIWEFYVNDKLERMGVDLDFNGKVDVWYRDELARAEAKKLAPPPAASASAAPSASGKKKEAL